MGMEANKVRKSKENPTLHELENHCYKANEKERFSKKKLVDYC
jgi:hypothetical protein